jgi:hypothetical protein
MLPKELNLALQKSKNEVFIYAWEYFTRRIHDELVRSVLDESQFFYVEINFDVIQKELPISETQVVFWEAFFEMLSTQKRNSDVCGFLKNNEGIAFLFVDSVSNTKDENHAWNRFCTQIEAKTSFDMRKWEGIVFGEYPPKEFFAAKV